MDVSMNARTKCPTRKRKSKTRCQEGRCFLNKDDDDDLVPENQALPMQASTCPCLNSDERPPSTCRKWVHAWMTLSSTKVEQPFMRSNNVPSAKRNDHVQLLRRDFKPLFLVGHMKLAKIPPTQGPTRKSRLQQNQRN